MDGFNRKRRWQIVWLGWTTAVAVIVTAWILSTCSRSRYVAKAWEIAVQTGQLHVAYLTRSGNTAELEQEWEPSRVSDMGFHVETLPFSLSSPLRRLGLVLPKYRAMVVATGGESSRGASRIRWTVKRDVMSCPLWIPALAVGGGMYVTWRARVPRGHCRRCRYDLTGNVSGVCPECGVEVQA